jgi:hypothetical protein
MDTLNEIFPIVLCFLGAVLLIVLIILITRLITTVDKVNILLDDLEDKSQSLNGLFDAVGRLGDTISVANNRITGFFAGVASKLFKEKKKKKKAKVEEEEEDDE